MIMLIRSCKWDTEVIINLSFQIFEPLQFQCLNFEYVLALWFCKLTKSLILSILPLIVDARRELTFASLLAPYPAIQP